MADQARSRKHFVLDVQAVPLTEDSEQLEVRSARPMLAYELALDPTAIAHLAEEDPASILMDLYIARTRWMN